MERQNGRAWNAPFPQNEKAPRRAAFLKIFYYANLSGDGRRSPDREGRQLSSPTFCRSPVASVSVVKSLLPFLADLPFAQLLITNTASQGLFEIATDCRSGQSPFLLCDRTLNIFKLTDTILKTHQANQLLFHNWERIVILIQVRPYSSLPKHTRTVPLLDGLDLTFKQSPAPSPSPNRLQ